MMTCQSLFKTLVLPSLLIVTLFTSFGCGKPEMDTRQAAIELNEPKSDATKERDEKFMVQAAEINFEEIMLAKLAQQRSVNDDFKAMAKMLEEYHRTANVDLRALAMQKSIAVPTAATNKVMEDYNQLNLEPVKEFEDAYFTMIIQNHETAINKFESYTSGPCDDAIKSWAVGLIPQMRIHLQKVMDVQNGISNPVSML